MKVNNMLKISKLLVLLTTIVSCGYSSTPSDYSNNKLNNIINNSNITCNNIDNSIINLTNIITNNAFISNIIMMIHNKRPAYDFFQ